MYQLFLNWIKLFNKQFTVDWLMNINVLSFYRVCISISWHIAGFDFLNWYSHAYEQNTRKKNWSNISAK